MSRPESSSDVNSRMLEAAAWCARLSEGPSSHDDAALLAWLAAHPENRQSFEALSLTLDDVEHFAGAPEMLKLREAALTEARHTHNPTRVSRFVRAAAIVLVVMSALVGVFLYLGHSAAFETRIGERRAFALPDGSALSLDAATQVKFDYSNERRRVILAHGRAKFDVARDPLRPFTVEAGGNVVVATGTSFSVELVEQEVHIILYEGHVEVIPASALTTDVHGGLRRTAIRSDTSLHPGEELVASSAPAPALVHVATIDVSRSLSWQGGDLAFKEEPLSIAVARVNRYSPQPLKIGDAQAGEVHISGVFHAGDTLAFIDGVTALFPIRAQHREDGTTLLFEERPKR